MIRIPIPQDASDRSRRRAYEVRVEYVKPGGRSRPRTFVVVLAPPDPAPWVDLSPESARSIAAALVAHADQAEDLQSRESTLVPESS